MEISLAVAFCLVIAAGLSIELKLSSAVLEILGGILLALLFVDISSVSWLHHLAQLGMLALMFVAGFEIEVDKLKKNWSSSVGIGVSSFFLPATGIFLITYFGFSFELLPAALVSVGLSTTSLALVYHFLKENGTLDSHNGQILFGAASVVDVLSMVALALLLGEVGWGTGIFVIFFVLSAFTLPHVGSWLFKRYPNSIAEPELRFLMVVLVGMAFLSESVGNIHPAIVAFTIGIVMSSVIEHNQAVEEKLLGLVFSFFAPIFFLHAGTRIDLTGLSMEDTGLAVIIFLAAVSLKYLGTYLPSRIFLKDSAGFGGILFNYRLSFGIITANVGLEKGIIDHNLYAIIMLVVVSSAALPGLFLRRKTI